MFADLEDQANDDPFNEWLMSIVSCMEEEAAAIGAASSGIVFMELDEPARKRPRVGWSDIRAATEKATRK